MVKSIKAIRYIFIIFLFCASISAKTIHVPGDSATIQAGINGAIDGDTVLVAPGNYTKGASITNLSIFILSQKGPDSTMLDGAGFGLVRGDSNTTEINGFTFTNTGHAIDAIGASPYIKNCNFRNNSFQATNPIGDEGGAAIFVSSSYSEAHISDCYFENNHVFATYYDVFAYGGAVNIRGGNATIERCLFVNNHADNGGAVSILMNSFRPSYINNCIFIANNGEYDGGAVFAVACQIYLTNCTFYANKALNSSGVSSSCQSYVSNCIFAYNEGNWPYRYKPISMTCTNIFGNIGGDWVGSITGLDSLYGNMSYDPLFCDTANNDLHLADNSPCAGASG